MSLKTRLVPSGCPDCGSECIQKCGDGGHQVCHDCGSMFEDDDAIWKEREITASIMKCPHCESVDAIITYGGEEQCKNCGLDPNNENIPTADLAHLWKARTPEMDDENLIQEIMLIPNANGEARFAASSNIGNFLRTICGPHCSYASVCPQTTKNFSRCYREERATEGDDMSKRGRGKNKAEKARRKEERKVWNQLHSRAWLFAPPEGWFVSKRNYESETIYQEQSGTGGDQSGT